MIGFLRSVCHVKVENEAKIISAIVYLHNKKSTVLSGVRSFSVDLLTLTKNYRCLCDPI